MLSTAPTSTVAAERYLDVLAELAPPGTLLDVRYRAGGCRLARFFIGMRARKRARLITSIGQRTDVYVGCAPRVRRSGGRADVAATALLWVDCDTPESSLALRSFVPAPAMIVASGTGENAHGYWPLIEPLSIKQVEQSNRRLASALGADQRCAEAARILRVPETLNHKHQPPRPVELCLYSPVRYAPIEILSALPPLPTREIPEPAPSVRWQHGDDDPLLQIAPARYVHALTGREPGRNGKINCPFHDDDTPSFHAYSTPERGWTCFGCPTSNGKPLGGDIYTLASLLWGISTRGRDFLRLRDRLDHMFGVRRD